MEATLTSGRLPQHTPEFLKDRRFMVMVPLLAIPFLTLAFWVLGGGSKALPGGSLAVHGLNADLPQAQFRDQKAQDKMSVYQNQKNDSASDKNSGVSQSFIKAMGFNPKDSAAARISPTAITAGPSSAEMNEAGIQAKLAALNRQVNQPGPESYSAVSTTAPSGGEVKRLELMMKAMNKGAGGTDPEMKQLGDMLDQINEIQNPGGSNSRLRNQSLHNHGRVYAVYAAKDEDDDGNPKAHADLVHYASYQTPGNGFIKPHTTVTAPGNTVQAVVHQDQTLVNGAVIKLRLLDGIYVNGKLVPKGSFVYGTCELSNERLIIKIASIRYLNNILPVALTVYDLDGMEGLYVPGSISRDAAKDGMGNAVQSMQLMAMNQSLGTQAASAGMEAAKGLFNHSVKQIKVKVKAGYEVLLKDMNDREN